MEPTTLVSAGVSVMIPKYSSSLEGQLLRERLSQHEYLARDLNAKLPMTRRCAYPISSPAVAGSCQCWGCHNAKARAAFSFLQTGPMPQLQQERHKKRGHMVG